MSQKALRITVWTTVLVVVAAAGTYAWYIHRRHEAKLAYMETATAAMHAGQLPKAAEAYQQALKIDPKLLAARTGLAEVYCSQGQVEKALHEHRRGCELAPRNPDAHSDLARTCLLHHRYPEAVEALERAVALAPSDAHLHLLLASAYRWNGEPEKAQAQLTEVEKLDPGSRAAQNARRALRRQAEREQAGDAGKTTRDEAATAHR